MELWGYDTGFRDEEEPTMRSLGEVSIAIREASELRRIAAFILYAADLLETHGTDFGHEHFRDWYKGWSNGDPDLIVGRID